VKRYTHIVLRRIPPMNGFSIKTPEGKFLSDIRPRGIVRELNRLNDRINKLEESGDAMHRYITVTRGLLPECANNWAKPCIYCMKVECECSNLDVSADMGAKG
jgi:hypothetical protein